MPGNRRPLPTLDYLASRLSYDAETGRLTWLANEAMGNKWNAIYAGKVAGTPHISGYVSIVIDKTKYLAHRLAFKFIHGRDPVPFVDHINGDRSDNRASNLREAGFNENAWNAKSQPRKHELPRGVRRYATRTQVVYQAAITVKGRQIYLGRHKTIEAAEEAYKTACAAFHGQFACPVSFRTANGGQR